MNVLSLGLGTNSIGELVGLYEHGEMVDAIIFANTVAERPRTYAMIPVLNEWLRSVGFPEITIVRVESTTLEQDCLRRNAVPSVAYGHKSCSQRFKTEPQEKFLNNWEPAKRIWAAGGKVTKLIGFDADEPWRAKPYSDAKTVNRYPLIEWDWGRDECIEAIRRAGLPQPGKSSCFFCPNMKQSEIRELQANYPDLAARALALEENAELTVIKGLGRDWSWKSLLATDEMFPFPEAERPVPCDCYDGMGS